MALLKISVQVFPSNQYSFSQTTKFASVESIPRINIKIVSITFPLFKFSFTQRIHSVIKNSLFITLPFHKRTQPSSPEEANIVPVIFHSTLQT